MWARAANLVARLSDDPDDTLEIRIQKRVLVTVSAAVGSIGALWGALYLAFDEPLAAAIPWTYALGVGASLFGFALTGRYRVFRVTQLFLILLLPYMLQLALGGFAEGSAVIIWSLLVPLGALAMWGRRPARHWLLGYIALVVGAQLIQILLPTGNNLPEWVIASFLVGNLVGAPSVAFFAIHYFVGQKDEALELLHIEQDKSERLLLNVLPKEIAQILKEDDQNIATRFPAMTCPRPGPDGSRRGRLPVTRHRPGNTTSAVPSRDELWPRHGRGDREGQVPIRRLGDTVNTASRIESLGVPGKIQLSPSTYDLIKDDFLCEPGGLVEVKGKGPMETWFLVGAR